jgi:hypothetical protein
MERWSADHQLLHQARADYDPGAQCPRYEAFVQGVFGGDQTKIDVMEEFFGWTFVQDTSYHKATGCGCAAERDAEAPPVSDGARRRAEPADRQSLALNTAPRHRTQSGSRAMNAGIAFQM